MKPATYAWPVLRPESPIESARLTLRPFGPGDLDDLYAYQSRPDVARYLHWKPVIALRLGGPLSSSAVRPCSSRQVTG
jgi:RimJ/RimL family protein N-acetyltransferase